MLRQIGTVLICGFLCLSLKAQNTAPERKVEGDTITSDRDPKLRIRLPQMVRYVGADRWILYDIADCELHAFVVADEQKRVQQLYWVQFEQYVPSRPELHHTYDSPRHAELGGMDFYVDTWVRSSDAPSKAGSDVEHIQRLILSKGFRLPSAMMSVRLVHLLDDQKRKELMIIYAEDVGRTELNAAELQEGGRAHERWPEIEDGLIKRAEKNIVIKQAITP